MGKEEIKHTICNNLNSPELISDGGVDYAWHTNVHDNVMTCDDIQKLGAGSIGRLNISAPCKDFALSRLLPNKYGGKLKNLRPRLQGRHGKVLLPCLQVTVWAHIFNLNHEIFCENLLFTDLVAD